MRPSIPAPTVTDDRSSDDPLATRDAGVDG